MIQGTTSNAGKSTLVAGLCRILARRGIRVAPFKPQNMALNSAVTADGGEIGRAQALQAMACNIPAHTDMNPVLIKPNSDCGSQIIIQGKAITELNAREYHHYKPEAMKAVLQSFDRLTQHYEMVIIEGAGSPAEINLREGDIANMGFAEAVDCPVILIADIDPGGVFAHVVGTLELLERTERERIIGTVINRFRGDYELLRPGVEWLEQHTKKPVYAVLPYLHGLHLDAEDAVDRQQILEDEVAKLRILVPRLPRISNHTDFDALRLNPHIDLQFVDAGASIPPADLIILAGSKSVRSDLQFLRDNGWQDALDRHLRYGGKVFGICGGYQMLGEFVHDKEGIEGTCGSSCGFAYLPLETHLKKSKQLERVQGTLMLSGKSCVVDGYEIHSGITTRLSPVTPLLNIERPECGSVASDNQVAGSYLHGIFDAPDAVRLLSEWVNGSSVNTVDINLIREQQLDRLADSIEQFMDIDALLESVKNFEEQKQQ